LTTSLIRVEEGHFVLLKAVLGWLVLIVKIIADGWSADRTLHEFTSRLMRVVRGRSLVWCTTPDRRSR